jgi:hypothetical protein
MISFAHAIWNTLTPLQRAAVLADQPQTEDVLSGSDLSAIKELFGCGCVADRYLGCLAHDSLKSVAHLLPKRDPNGLEKTTAKQIHAGIKDFSVVPDSENRPDRFRNPMLYPFELRAREKLSI